jgi:vacuolar protein sorting-associated protein 54
MGDRLSAHLRALAAVDWVAPAPAGRPVSDYMELLVKETVTLHKVLSRYLALPVVEYVMSQVFASITHRLAEAYGAIELPTADAKARLLADARFLHERLANLRGVRMPSAMLETVVGEKPVGPPALTPAPLSPALGPPLSPGREARSPTLAPPAAPAPMTANARIKGMFARASMLNAAAGAFADVKRAPSPTPTPPEKPLPLPLSRAGSMDGRSSPTPMRRTTSGFREVADEPQAVGDSGP